MFFIRFFSFYDKIILVLNQIIILLNFIIFMNSKSIILITNGYPYNNGETFLEPELEYLSTVFDRIFILSINNNHFHKRKTPKNVSVVQINASLNLKQKVYAFANLILRFRYYYNIFREEISDINKYINSYKKIKSTVFHDLIVAIRTKDVIEKIMEDNVLNYGNTLLYSYWLNSSTTALSLIKTEHEDAVVISRAHGSDVYFEMSRTGFYSFRLFNLRKLNKLFSVSNKGKQYHIDSFGINVKNIIVSYLGISNNKGFKEIDYTGENELLLVSVSNVVELKRTLLIPELLLRLEGIKIKWVHFGDGVLFDELKEQSKILLSKLDNISYEFFGAVENKVVLNYYAKNNVNLFISLSSSEGIPVSMMEAMSFGIPVVSTDVGGVNELVKSDNGFIVNQDVNMDEISEVIIRYSSMNTAEKNRIRRNAYNHWNNYFNAEKNFPIFANQLLELL